MGSQYEGMLLFSWFCLCASIINEAVFCGESSRINHGNL